MKTKKNISKTSSKKEKSKKEQSTSEFPGYPLYAAADDIMNRADRVDTNLENPKGSPQIAAYVPTIDTDEDESSLNKRSKKIVNRDSDVTREDLEALGSLELESDNGDDEDLKRRTMPVDFAGKDLDIPGSEDDDVQESLGSEDEENNSYSIGGDDHNDLEEDKPEVF